MEAEAFASFAQFGAAGSVGVAFMTFLWRALNRERALREAVEKEFRDYLRQHAETPPLPPDRGI